MSAKPSIPARPSAKPTIPQRPSVRSKPAAPAKPSASAKRAAVVVASKVPTSKVPGAKVAAKSSASQRTPSHARGVAQQGNRTPVGRSGPQSLPTLNPVAVVVADAAVGVSRSPQPSLLPPAESVPRVRTEASGPQEASGRAVVKVARVKRGKSSDGANSKRVGPSGLPGSQTFKPKQPPGIGAVTASEINLLLEMDTNSKAKKQLMQKKQVAAEVGLCLSPCVSAAAIIAPCTGKLLGRVLTGSAGSRHGGADRKEHERRGHEDWMGEAGRG